jgi:hypothetical protein
MPWLFPEAPPTKSDRLVEKEQLVQAKDWRLAASTTLLTLAVSFAFGPGQSGRGVVSTES